VFVPQHYHHASTPKESWENDTQHFSSPDTLADKGSGTFLAVERAKLMHPFSSTSHTKKMLRPQKSHAVSGYPQSIAFQIFDGKYIQVTMRVVVNYLNTLDKLVCNYLNTYCHSDLICDIYKKYRLKLYTCPFHNMHIFNNNAGPEMTCTLNYSTKSLNVDFQCFIVLAYFICNCCEKVDS